MTLSQRTRLRTAYAATLRDLLALSAPNVAVRCPSGACLLCGVASVNRAAFEVARRGGVEETALAVWRSVNTAPVALGGHGPNSITGHVCPACANAIDDAGSVGPSARGRAVVDHVRRTKGHQRADRLRSLLSDDFPPTLPGWGAVPGARPSAEPWAHLRRVIDRL